MLAACARPPQPPPRLEPLASGGVESLRGLSVVDDRVAWASGTRGAVGVSVDGGASWRFRRVPGHETTDFRDVHAVSAERALVLGVGSPGVLLETADGGATWTERWRDARPEVFLDGFEFFDERRGLAFGDPIDGRFLLLVTADGGRSWSEPPVEARPVALAGEAAFAASGTSIRVDARGRAAIGTGGARRARVLVSDDFGASWRAHETPLAAGAASRGVFSLLLGPGRSLLAVGGDHAARAERAGVAARSGDLGASWTEPAAGPGGYRSAVERLADGSLVATGPGGTDRSSDDGATWQPLDAAGYHAVRRARTGSLVLLSGSDGRIARLVAAPP
jgi:photosystem II stability/assembly factor-like uncharacterized protein